MTPIQHGLLRHTLGLDRRKTANRNNFATEPGADDFEHITRLVENGFMAKGAKIPGGLTYYHATEAGVAAAKLEYPECKALIDAVTPAPNPPTTYPEIAAATKAPDREPHEVATLPYEE